MIPYFSIICNTVIKKFFREYYHQGIVTKRENGCREPNARARMAEVASRLRAHGQALVFVECVYGQSLVNSQSIAGLVQSLGGQTKLWETGKVQHPSNKFPFSWQNLKHID